MDKAENSILRGIEGISTFALYRPEPPADYIEKGAAVAAELPQLYGCVFPDGTTVIRWMTLAGSVAIFPTFEDFNRIHGHPEYGTRMEWSGIGPMR